MAEHTEGPWEWDKHGDLRSKDRNAVINPNLRSGVLSGINRQADARLIAAAPRLYDYVNEAAKTDATALDLLRELGLE